MKVEDQRYTLTEGSFAMGDSTSIQSMRRSHDSFEDSLDRHMDERLKEVIGCINGINPTSADRICLLIEFCYLLELHQQAVDLHGRLDRNEVDPDWLKRVDTIVRTSRMRL